MVPWIHESNHARESVPRSQRLLPRVLQLSGRLDLHRNLGQCSLLWMWPLWQGFIEFSLKDFITFCFYINHLPDFNHLLLKAIKTLHVLLNREIHFKRFWLQMASIPSQFSITKLSHGQRELPVGVTAAPVWVAHLLRWGIDLSTIYWIWKRNS